MKVLKNSQDLRCGKKIIATIGVFDGVHLGHQKIIRSLVKRADKKHMKAAVLTFCPHPSKVLNPQLAPPMLLSLQHRLKILCDNGIDVVFIFKFDRQLANLSCDEFVKTFLVKKLNIRELFIGESFRLGYRRRGNLDVLSKCAVKYNIAVKIIKGKKIKGRLISSTLIRKLVSIGNLREAASLLGRRFSVLGTVIHGDKRGRILGFPTANLDLHHEAVPPAGVYAVLVRIYRKRYCGILNIGFRPTFENIPKQRTVEVHLFDFNRDIYKKDLEVFFIRKIRDEKHFGDRDHLKEQINADIRLVKRMFRKDHRP